MPQFFTSADVRAILGIPQRTLDYWDERDVVKPSKTPAAGKGTSREYTFDDLLDLSVVQRLRQMGLSLQRIRKGLAYLRETKPGKRIGKDIVLVTDGEDLFEKRRRDKTLVSVLHKGQTAFSVVFLGQISEQLEQTIKLHNKDQESKQASRKAKSA
jgi:DNA-binding transcriptional MerR regulator